MHTLSVHRRVTRRYQHQSSPHTRAGQITNQTYSPFASNIQESTDYDLRIDSLYNILHPILSGTAMRMAY